jgi:site-specific DNA recombinase
MTKQTAIYARVSTDDQAERGYSLPSQVEACQQFAKQKGFDVAAVYQDDISGAKPITSRPDGGQLQRAIEMRQIKTVIVYQVDRLSRDIVDLLATVRDWLRAGVDVYSLDVGQVTSELDIVLVIKGWQGGDERQKIRERTMRGKNAKARAGKVVGEGIAPYGYIHANGELLIKETEAEVVRMIYNWYVNGDEHGGMMGLVGIARRLTEMGIPTPSQSKRINSNRANYGVWFYATVNWIIQSETYCGVLRYGRRVSKGGKVKNRPQEEHILIDVPAIVSRELWELAQARRAYNSKIAKRRTKREYLLRGLIYCGCGRRMAGTAGRYLCTRHYNTNGGECDEPIVVGGLVECITWDYIMGLITNPIQFEQKLRQAQAQEAETMQPKQKELENILALLNETEKEAEQIAWELRKTKGIIRAKLEQQGEEVNRRYQVLTARMMVLEEALAHELTDGNIDNLLQFREAVATGLQNPTFEDRRRWLEILQATVTVKNQIAVVSCRLGGKPLQYRLILTNKDLLT